MFIEHGCNVQYAAEIKKHVKTPVAALGGINDVDMMEEIIASGKADIIEVARQSLADPYFPEKAFSGKKRRYHTVLPLLFMFLQLLIQQELLLRI